MHTNFVRKIEQMENKDGSLGYRTEKLNIKIDGHADIQKVHTKMLASILDNRKDSLICVLKLMKLIVNIIKN